MEEHASRSLGEPGRTTGTHLEGRRRTRARKAVVTLGEPARDARTAVERIDELDGLRDVVAEGVALRRTKPRLCSSKSRTLTELAPRRVDARKRRRHVRLSGQARTREERAGVRHGVFLDMGFVVVGVEGLPRAHEPRVARGAHRVVAFLHHGEHIARRLDVGDREAVEQVDRLLGEGQHRFHLLGERQVLVARDLVREAAHDRRDRVDGAPAHLRAELVAQCLQGKRLVEQLGRLGGQGKHARVPREVGRREHEQVRCVVLQVRPVDQKLAQGMRAIAHLDAEDALDRQKVGDHVARRADAADARGDVGDLGERAAAHHALEQARRLHDVHLAGCDRAVLDREVNVAVALDTRDMVNVDRTSHLASTPRSPRKGRGSRN